MSFTEGNAKYLIWKYTLYILHEVDFFKTLTNCLGFVLKNSFQEFQHLPFTWLAFLKPGTSRRFFEQSVGLSAIT